MPRVGAVSYVAFIDTLLGASRVAAGAGHTPRRLQVFLHSEFEVSNDQNPLLETLYL